MDNLKKYNNSKKEKMKRVKKENTFLGARRKIAHRT
jgi:hypothetical protein